MLGLPVAGGIAGGIWESSGGGGIPPGHSTCCTFAENPDAWIWVSVRKMMTFSGESNLKFPTEKKENKIH